MRLPNSPLKICDPRRNIRKRKLRPDTPPLVRRRHPAPPESDYVRFLRDSLTERKQELWVTQLLLGDIESRAVKLANEIDRAAGPAFLATAARCRGLRGYWMAADVLALEEETPHRTGQTRLERMRSRSRAYALAQLLNAFSDCMYEHERIVSRIQRHRSSVAELHGKLADAIRGVLKRREGVA